MNGVISRAATGEFLVNFNDNGQEMSIIVPYTGADYKVSCPNGYAVGQSCTIEYNTPASTPAPKKTTAVEWVAAGTGVIGATAALIGAIRNNGSNTANTATGGNGNYTPSVTDSSPNKPNYLLWGGLALLLLAIVFLVIRSLKNKAA